MTFANLRNSTTSTRRSPRSNRATQVDDTSSWCAIWYCWSPLRFRSRTKNLISRWWLWSSVVRPTMSPRLNAKIAYEQLILPTTDVRPQPQIGANAMPRMADNPLILWTF